MGLGVHYFQTHPYVDHGLAMAHVLEKKGPIQLRRQQDQTPAVATKSPAAGMAAPGQQGAAVFGGSSKRASIPHPGWIWKGTLNGMTENHHKDS